MSIAMLVAAIPKVESFHNQSTLHRIGSQHNSSWLYNQGKYCNIFSWPVLKQQLKFRNYLLSTACKYCTCLHSRLLRRVFPVRHYPPRSSNHIANTGKQYLDGWTNTEQTWTHCSPPPRAGHAHPFCWGPWAGTRAELTPLGSLLMQPRWKRVCDCR